MCLGSLVLQLNIGLRVLLYKPGIAVRQGVIDVLSSSGLVTGQGIVGVAWDNVSNFKRW